MCSGESKSILRCQTATDFFTKTAPKKIRNQGKVVPYVFGRDIFAIFRTYKGHIAVSDEQMVRLEV